MQVTCCRFGEFDTRKSLSNLYYTNARADARTFGGLTFPIDDADADCLFYQLTLGLGTAPFVASTTKVVNLLLLMECNCCTVSSIVARDASGDFVQLNCIIGGLTGQP